MPPSRRRECESAFPLLPLSLRTPLLKSLSPPESEPNISPKHVVHPESAPSKPSSNVIDLVMPIVTDPS